MSHFWRYLGPLLGTALAGFAAIQIAATRNPAWESRLCDFSVCSPDELAQRAYLQFLEGNDAQDQISGDVKRAVLLDPASSYRWCDYGEALLDQGDAAGAERCFRRAVELGPRSSPILLRTADFYFQIDQPQKALGYLKRILSDISEYDSMAFSLFDRLGGSTEQILALGIPEQARPAQAYFRYLAARGDYNSAWKTWTWIRQRGFVDEAVVTDCVNFLIRTKHYAQAQATWSDFLDGKGGDYPQRNLVYNGGFDSEIRRVALDWRIAPHELVRTAVEGGELHVTFPGTDNVTFRNVTHQVVAPPGRYVLRADVRAEGITTDQGVWLQLLDVDSPGRLSIGTQPLQGTVNRRTEQLAFTVLGDTRLLEIRLVREPSEKFDNKIEGEVWLDNVTIAAARN